MDVQIIQTIPQQHKLKSIFSADIQCQQFENLITENKHTLYRGKSCIVRFCTSLRKQAKNIIELENKKNVTVNKRKIKITLRCKSMLYLWKKNLRKAL